MIRVVRDAGGCPCPSDEGNEPTVTRVEIALDECWTLGAHSTYRGRSALGDLLSRAKYGPDRPSADRVAACMGWWAARSEERRVGKECFSQFRSRWSPEH